MALFPLHVVRCARVALFLVSDIWLILCARWCPAGGDEVVGGPRRRIHRLTLGREPTHIHERRRGRQVVVRLEDDRK